MKEYELVKNQPVARFYYKGQHNHPIRRTVLVVEENKNTITGYELREGKITRSFLKSPIKSYRKDKIAKFGDYCRLKMNQENCNKKDSDSTLLRENLENLIFKGI